MIGRLSLFDEWRNWYKEFRHLLTFYMIDFQDLDVDEREHIKEMFRSGAWPDEAVEELVTGREYPESREYPSQDKAQLGFDFPPPRETGDEDL